jgi:HEAT repeat protein
MKTIVFAFALLLVSLPAASGYAVGPPVGLEDLSNQADLIFQGTAVSNTTVDDAAFQSIPGFIVQETTFRPAYKVKGQVDGREMKFRHYAPNPSPEGFMYAPQSYSFEIGRSYLVFAKQSQGSDPGTCRQIWMSHTGMMDEGVLLCFRSFPFPERTIRETVWRDLTEMLKNTDAKDLVYAIQHLEVFSGSHDPMRSFGELSEFQRTDVLAAIHELINHPDPSVAQAAIEVIGSHNPYMSQQYEQQRLANVGSAEMPGYMRLNPDLVNEGGLIYWRELAAVVDGKADDATRALAVRALGLVREPSLESSVKRWLGDKSAAVRESAVLLLADYPALASHDGFTALAGDPDPGARISTAYVIGFTQNVEEIGVLVKLISDSDANVRQAASQCLLSFSPKDPRVEKIFRDNLNNPETRPLFIVALGQQDPAANLALLVDEAAKKTDPQNWPGGQIPAYTASQLIFNYLKGLPAADLQSGKYDKALDALELWRPNYAVDPQFVYALELKDGLKDRAKKFRVEAAKAAPYDTTFLDRADQDPQQYLY